MKNEQPNAPRLMPEPAGFRTRYRSEPGMIGHYPWTYADHGRRRAERPECESEDLYTNVQVLAMLAAERDRCMSAVKRAIMETPTAHLLSRDILFANIHAALTPNYPHEPAP